ncbi:cytochrome C biogenesis protein CcmF [Sulfurifustis variabilis]|uniref:Cytochrome C biogenesis protein CcmF n=1 Tax=Sulfurifustis variabilis TaxID=1675686 RepID=A0A1B4V2E1_9GAMM|nr:heme lyase CcmF/NrfE family subunit [Sulfurifustis variabilis]BAU47673.1 cytochrome C biogenesis protein CcmF [Sulfurifustis variabilis]
MNLSLHLVELGHFAAYMALVAAGVQAVAPLAARWLRAPQLAAMSVNATIAVFALTSLGGAALIHAFVSSNFSVQYVAANSNLQLPLFYKVAALWGGHEGSLYLWVWVLTLYTAIVAWHGRRHYPQHLPVILAVQGWLVIGFFGLILFLSNPFERLIPMPPDGRDLNPLLQDPGMVFHPPMLYLGYVGTSVPFAFAMAALLTRWKSELWIGHIRRWALVAWGFLTTGILLGGWWAYYELGWGGYWAWDPVENASFMPWLLATALVHSITVQDRRRMLHAWNIFLVISTFSLSLLGTFLVRSGVLSSVHAFAVDPGRGAYILAFMTLVLGVSFGIFLAKGRYQQAEEAITSFLSRESLFVWNNVIFTVACACVLLGTLYPLALDAFTGMKITVGAPYFNTVLVPIFLVLILLMAIGPLVPWRKANVERLRHRLLWPAIVGIVAAVATVLVFGGRHWTAPVGAGLALFAAAALITDYLRAIRQRRVQLSEPWGRAALKTVLGNRRHYGGMVVHFGIVIMTLGFIGSGLFRSEAAVVMGPGEELVIAGERLRFEGVRTFRRANYESTEGAFVLNGSGGVVTPERRRYPRQEAPMTETGIHSTPLRDVYVVLAEPVGDGRWGVHVYVNPLVQFIWFGGGFLLGGLALSLSGRRKARAAGAEAPAGAVAVK